MRTLTFTLNVQTGDDGMAPATLTIVELEDGSLQFTITNDQDNDGLIGDIRGLFFDVADDSLLGGLTFAGAEITEVQQDGDVSNLGGGVTTSGVPDSPFEIGIEFGTSGMSTDDYQTVTFVMSSADRPLTLDDIALESLAVRQTSVSSADGGREDSDKLYGDAPYPVNAVDDATTVYEDTVGTGNVFANDIDLDAGDADGDGIPDGLTITAIDGDAGNVGQPIVVAPGISVTVNADGSYSADAVDADWLAEGETYTTELTYAVDDGNGGSDTAVLTVTVIGVNDTPDAVDDAATTDEATAISGNVLPNDSDPDLSDVLTVSAINGVEASVGQEVLLESGALLTLDADGTFSYDPNGAFDSLNDGDVATDSFTYQVSDGHGGFDTATVTLTIEGIGDGGSDNEGGEDHFGTFSNKQGTADHEISNVVLYLDDGQGGILKVKIDGWYGETDLDNVNLDTFLDSEGYDEYELVAVSIKAGNNHNKDLGPGEGQLFLLDGDEDIDYLQGGDVPDGLTMAILGAKVDETVMYDPDLFT